MFEQSQQIKSGCFEAYRNLPVPTYMWQTNPQQEIILIDYNDAAAKMYGPKVKKLSGQNYKSIYAEMPEIVAAMEQCRDLRTPVVREVTKHLCTTGELKYLQCTWTWLPPDKLLFHAQDITAQKVAEAKQLELEAYLRQKYKMEAVGVMANGAANNFKNGLSMVLSSLDMARSKLPNGCEALGYIKRARATVLQSRDLILQLQAYGRSGATSKAPVQLSIILEETLNLLRETLPATVQLDQQISPRSYHAIVNADSSDIHEVLISLAENAVQAMGDVGRLMVFLDITELTETDIQDPQRRAPGYYACISMIDNGSGMDPGILEKIFDPFFTTKESSTGVGMGLSSIQGVIEQHDGLIKVLSTPGTGSTFKLYFPVASPETGSTAITA